MRWGITLALVIALILFDQGTKNYFASVSAEQHAPLLVNAAILTACLLLYKGTNSRLNRAAVLLILSGGISNALDIILSGKIKDVVTISIFNLNIADVFIVLGSSCLILYSLHRAPQRSP